MTIKTSKLTKILIIRLRPAGDTILSTPIFRELKNKFPDCKISCVIESPFNDILLNNPYIDQLFVYNRKSFFSYLKLLTRIFLSRFDLTIDLKNNSRSSTISLFSLARYKIGLNKSRNYFYSHKINNTGANTYTVNTTLNFLTPLDIYSNNVNLDFFLSQNESIKSEKYWSDLFPNNKLRCVVYISGKYPTQRWPKTHFIKLVQHLATLPNINILIVGGKDEFNLAKEIAESSKTAAKPCQDTSLRELAAIISKSNLMISADTGPRHFATAFDIPTVTLFTSTSTQVWNPPNTIRNPFIVAKGVTCIPCQKRECTNMRCLDELLPEDVFNCVQELIRTAYPKI